MDIIDINKDNKTVTLQTLRTISAFIYARDIPSNYKVFNIIGVNEFR